MKLKRQWDSSCPHVYKTWEGSGSKWVIQDLDPKDDEEAVKILLEHLVPDETTCISSKMTEDEVSMRSMRDYWREAVKQRMSLACYAEKGGVRELVAVNCCVVHDRDDEEDTQKIEGDAWINVYNSLKYMEDNFNAFDYLGTDRLLFAMGLVVRREYRGFGLGSRLLAAREPLALSQGIKGTSTVFTGVASQKSAEKAGFETVLTATLADFHNAGLKYPKDDTTVIKYMVKKYL